MTELDVKQTSDGVVFAVKVVPGSSRTAFVGLIGSMVKVKVATAPEKGKANECLMAFLASALGIRKNDIEIVRGKTSQMKYVRVGGLSSKEIRAYFKTASG